MTSDTAPPSRIATVTRTVPDLSAARRFYASALDATPEGDPMALSAAALDLLDAAGTEGWRQTLRLGQQSITLLSFLPQGRPMPADGRSDDLGFQHCAVVVSDMARALAQVMQAGARPITEGGPQRLPANTGGVVAFKFRDPAGHPLELLAFPASVGDPAWHGVFPPLFQGIDHTAIVVSDAAASAAFYGDVLELRAVGRSFNRGAEQDRLDAVPRDQVDVVALQPETAPPHLELLGYRTVGRRATPPATGIDALASRTIMVGDIDRIASRLGARGHPMKHGRWDRCRALGFRDPDGHRWICRTDRP